MLEDCSVERRQDVVIRIASVLPETARTIFLKRGVHIANVQSIVSALEVGRTPLTAKEVVDKTFRPREDRRTPFSVGRFGDGTMGVYYSALDEVTCERELGFHLESNLVELKDAGFSYPRRDSAIECHYSGATADLRWKETTHSYLVSKTSAGYPSCQRLAREAVQKGLHGFLTRSARHAGGTCVPVFARSALTNPDVRYDLAAMATDSGIVFRRS